jgi:hypothetical protein
MTKRNHRDASEAEIIDDNKDEKYCNYKNNWSVNRIFWGLLLIVIGGLMLADNLDAAVVDWSNLWKLWPLIIISCGLSILAIRSLIWKALSLLFVIATMGIIIWAAVGSQSLPGTPQIFNSMTVMNHSNGNANFVSITNGLLPDRGNN